MSTPSTKSVNAAPSGAGENSYDTYKATQTTFAAVGGALGVLAGALRGLKGPSGGKYRMQHAAIAASYDTLHAQYLAVVKMRGEIEKQDFTSSNVSPRMWGVRTAASNAELTYRNTLRADLLAVEIELAAVLQGIYDAYHGSAATDAATADQIAAAAAHASGEANVVLRQGGGLTATAV